MKARWLITLLAFVGAITMGVTSAPARAGAATPTKVLPYTKVWYGNLKLQTVDIYRGAKANSRLVVLVHGGAWESDDAAWNSNQALNLQAAGDAVFVVNYRSDSPTQAAFPMEVDDVVAGTQWSIKHAATYNADPKNVIYVGGSAGGTLVSLATERLNTTGHRIIEAVVTLSGATDFTLIKPLDVEQAQALGCKPTSCSPAVEKAASPAEHVTKGTCPARWLTINGSKEKTPLPQAEAMHDALQKQGCDSTLVIHPGDDHAWQYWNSELPTILKFIAS